MSRWEDTQRGPEPGPSTDQDSRSTDVDIPVPSAARSASESLVGRACDDLIERWRRGDHVPIETFCEDWPADSPRPDDLFELIYTEYLLREELGESAFELIAGRFPDQAERLRRQVAMHRLLAVDDDLSPIEETVPENPVAAHAEASWPAPVGYEIRRLLGRGGMGVVYEARQVRLNRIAALKMIRAGIHASNEDRIRFIAEAEAIARLQHPNIVQVHSFGEFDGQPFFEMEYVDGGSLADRLDGTPGSPRDSATMLEIVARAIHEAHCRGVVHRDLKPSNILLTADGSPKIVDFGLAKLIGSESGLTRTDSVLGSPTYMAPEQAAGKAGAVGPSADVYALGAIYYEMLTGRPPFVAETTLETLDLVRHAEPVPPSRLRPGLPRDVETVCLRCLAKDPARRYASAEALADDLGRWLRGESIQARPTSLVERGYRWSIRNRTIAALIASVVLLLIGGTTGMAILWARARSEMYTAQTLAGKEAEAKRELGRISAGLMLDRGQALAEAGDVARGLHFMARALQIDADNKAGLDNAVRTNLSAWSELIPRSLRSTRLSTPAEVALASDDGKIVAIGGRDGSLTLWDEVEARVIHRSGPRPGGPIIRMAFQPGNRVLAAMSRDVGAPQLWDVSTGRPIGEPLRTAHGRQRLAFHPDGSILATSADGAFWLWDVATGRSIVGPSITPDQIEDIAFSPDGKTMVLVNKSGGVERRDGRTGRLLPGDPITVNKAAWTVTFHPDGSRFAVGFGPIEVLAMDHRDLSGVQVYETATGRPIGPRLRHDIGVFRLAYRSDGKVLLSGDLRGTAKLWDASTGQPIGEPMRGEGEIDQVAFSPDRSVILTRSGTGMMRLWDVLTARQIGSTLEQPGLILARFADHGRLLSLVTEDLVRSVDITAIVTPARTIRKENLCTRFSGDGQSILTGGREQVARISSTIDGQVQGWPMPHLGHIEVADFSPDRRLIATGGSDATVRIWDAQGRPKIPPIPVRHWVSAVRFSPDSRRLLAADLTGAVRLIDVATGKTLGKTIVHDAKIIGATVAQLFFSPDGRVGYSVGSPGSIGRLDGITGEPIGDFWDFPSPAPMGRLSPDGRTILLVSDQRVRLIDVETGKERVPAFGQGVRDAIFMSGGRTIVSGGDDKMVRFWDAATGLATGQPIPHPLPVRQLQIGPDSRTLFTYAEGGRARVWDLASRKPIGPSWPQDHLLARMTLSPDGRYLALTDSTTRIYPVPSPETTPVDLIPRRIAALTAMNLDDQGVIAPTADSSTSIGEDAFAIGPDEWNRRASASLALRGDHASALLHLDQLVVRRPGDWRAHAARSESLARLGRLAEAAAEADRARSLAGPLQAAQWDAHRGFDAVDHSRWDDAIDAFDRVLAFGPPGPALFHNARGWARAKRKDWAGASADLSVGSWRNFSMLNDYGLAAMIALAAGDRRFHREVVGHILAKQGTVTLANAQAANFRALIASLGPDAVDDPQLLVRLAEPALQIADARHQLQFRYTIGAVLYRAGRFQAAIDQLTQVYRDRRVDECFEARAFLAMAHRRLGRAREARAWLELLDREPTIDDEMNALIRLILTREAKAVVLDTGFPADPFAAPGEPASPDRSVRTW